jgi:hypothetical protein
MSLFGGNLLTCPCIARRPRLPTYWVAVLDRICILQIFRFNLNSFWPCPLAAPKQELACLKKVKRDGGIFRSSLCSGWCAAPARRRASPELVSPWFLGGLEGRFDLQWGGAISDRWCFRLRMTTRSNYGASFVFTRFDWESNRSYRSITVMSNSSR